MKYILSISVLLALFTSRSQQKFNSAEVFHYACFSDDLFLEKYGLAAYLCPHDRFLYYDSSFLENISPKMKRDITKRLERFEKWNSDSSFRMIPDTVAIMTGIEFAFQEKLYSNPLLEYIFNCGEYPDSSVRINVNGHKKYYINRDNIFYIHLIEYSYLNSVSREISIDYLILIKCLDGTLKSYNEIAENYRGY